VNDIVKFENLLAVLEAACVPANDGDDVDLGKGSRDKNVLGRQVRQGGKMETLRDETKIFDSMSKEEALSYCYKYRNQYISDLYAADEDGLEQFNCLIAILEGDTIKPSQLPDYGMDYEEA